MLPSPKRSGNEPSGPQHEQVKTIAIIFAVLLGASMIVRAGSVIVIGGVDGILPDDSTPQAEVVLAMSGGGARGLAGAGVLKAFEENLIAIKAIAGTSIGGIVGGLYACGYEADQLREIIEAIDFPKLFANEPPRASMLFTQRKDHERHLLSVRFDGFKPLIPHALTGGQELTSLLARLTLRANYRCGGDFMKLRVPFRTVCSDIVSGRLVVLDTGSLADAMRATMAFPLAFTGVEQGEQLLMDGGILMPVPVTIARGMCTTSPCVVAVNTTSPLVGKSALTSPVVIANQVTSVMSADALTTQLNQADFVITPSLNGISSSDFRYRDSIIKLGYIAGRDAAAAILSRLRQRGDSDLMVIDSVDVVSDDAALSDRIAKDLRGIHLTKRELVTALKSIARRERLFRLEADIDSSAPTIAAIEIPPHVRLRITAEPALAANDITVDVSGAARFPDDSIRSWLLATAVMMTSEQLKKGVDSIERRYFLAGYDLATIRSRHVDYSARSIALVIDEGVVRRVDVSHRGQTRDWVVRSYFPLHRDDPFSIEKAVQGMGAIFGADLFDRVTLHAVPADGGTDIHLQVRDYQSIQARLGWHWNDRYQSEEFVELLNDNVLGMGIEYLLHAQYGLDRQSYYGELKADRIFSTYHFGRLRAGYSRLQRTTFDSNRRPNGLRDESSFGLMTQLGQQIARLGTVTAGWSIERIRYDDGRYPREAFTLSSLNLESVVENFDRLPFPTSGKQHVLQLKLTGKYLRSDREFNRFFSSLEGYYSLTPALTYHPRVSLGLSNRTLPASERFYLGGMRSLVGWRQDVISGDKMLLINQEMRYRMIPRVYVSLLYDFGNAYNRLDQFKLSTLHHGLGLALAIDTPVGPFELNWGRSSQDQERVYFSAGFRF
jgi:NTE family protein